MARYTSLLLCLTATFMTLIVGAPTSKIAKRAGEVIFFENQQKGSAVNKRSERWPVLTSKEDDKNISPQKANYPELKLSGSNKKVDDEDVEKHNDDYLKFDQKTVEAIEEAAFYEALQFLVNKLVSQASTETDKDTAGDEPISDDNVMAAGAAVAAGVDSKDEVDDNLYILPTTELPRQQQAVDDEHKASDQPSHETERDSAQQTDQEANQLALLMKMAEQQEKNEKISSKKKAEPTNEQSAENMIPSNELPSKSNDGKILKATPKPPAGKLSLGEEHYDNGKVLTSLSDYMDYLNMLNTVERQLKQELEAYKDADAGEAGEPDKVKSTGKIRRKRDVAGSPEDPGLWSIMGKEKDFQPNKDGGVCFNAKELAELKELLVGLAVQNTLRYGSDKSDEGAEGALYLDAVPVPRSRSAYDYGQRRNELRNLGYKLDHQGSTYRANEDSPWSYYRK